MFRVKSLPDQDLQPEQPLLCRVFQPPEQPRVHDVSCSDRSPFQPVCHSTVSSSLAPEMKTSPSSERLKPNSLQFSHPVHWVVLDHPSTVSSIPSAFCSRMLTPYSAYVHHINSSMGDEPESASSTGLTVSTDTGSVSGNNDNTPESGVSYTVFASNPSAFERIWTLWYYRSQDLETSTSTTPSNNQR